jgi:hypothetical protein
MFQRNIVPSTSTTKLNYLILDEEGTYFIEISGTSNTLTQRHIPEDLTLNGRKIQLPVRRRNFCTMVWKV